MKVKIIASILLCIVMTISTQAKQSLDGLSGLIQMPTAEVVNFQNFEVDADFDFNVKTSQKLYTGYQYKINMGTFENLEMGIVKNTLLEEGVYLNAKYLLMTDQSRYPVSLALGTRNIGSKNNSQAFLVLSKPWPNSLFFHFGFKAIFEEKLRSEVMLGFEYAAFDWMTFQLEVLENEEKYMLNAGFYFMPISSFHLRVSGLDIAREDFSRLNMGLGFSFFL